MFLPKDLPAQAQTCVPNNKEKLPVMDTAGETTQYSFFSTQLDEVAHAPSILQLKSSSAIFEQLMETGTHGGIWWLHVASPTHDDIDRLSRIFDVHPLTTEDIKMREVREKVDLFRNYYFISLRPPQQPGRAKGVRSSSANVYGIVFRESVISFTYGNSQHHANIWNRIKEHPNRVSLSSDWICYAIIDDIVDGFAPLIDRVQTGIEMMEDGVSVTQPDDIGLALQSIFKYRKEITRIHQVLRDKTDVVRSFARHCENLASTPLEVTLYLSDIQDHVLTMMASLANAEQMLSRSQSKYSGQLSFDFTCMRNRTAGTLGRLTAIGGILITMQVITMLFGMNVHVPGQDATGLSWWFGILGFIIGLSLLCLVVAKRSQII